MQALYQIQMTGDSAHTVSGQFCSEQNMDRVDVDYFKELLSGIAKEEQGLLSSFEPILDRPLAELDPVEKSILLIGSFEMQHRLDVPYRVVINEGVELAKQFGASESYRYVNSILDALAKNRTAGK